MIEWLRPWRWRRQAVEVLLVVAVVVASTLALRGPAESQRFTIDESRWISTSRYFWITFVRLDLLGADWSPNYVVLTHPPVARYVIGFGLWAQGWREDQLNGRYDSLRSARDNAQAGNIPGPDLLAAARRVTFPFAVASMALIYGVARLLAGRVAGLASVGLALTSPLLPNLWTRALAESILAFLGLVALLLALWVLPRLPSGTVRPWLPIMLGVTLGLGAATKLSGGIAAVGLATFGTIQQGLAVVRTRHTSHLRGWVDLSVSAVIVFVVVNPLLYAGPVPRTLALIEHRFDEMEFQQDVFESQAVPDGIENRVGRLAQRVFVTNATASRRLPVSPDVLLVPAGALLLGLWAVRDLRRGYASAPLLFLCWLVAQYAVLAVSLGFDSAHYYAPLLVANVVCSGVAIGLGIRAVARQLTATPFFGRGRAGQKTQMPAA